MSRTRASTNAVSFQGSVVSSSSPQTRLSELGSRSGSTPGSRQPKAPGGSRLHAGCQHLSGCSAPAPPRPNLQRSGHVANVIRMGVDQQRRPLARPALRAPPASRARPHCTSLARPAGKGASPAPTTSSRWAADMLVANLRARGHAGRSPAVRVTRYSCKCRTGVATGPRSSAPAGRPERADRERLRLLFTQQSKRRAPVFERPAPDMQR
jgi:hypothetical protein